MLEQYKNSLQSVTANIAAIQKEYSTPEGKAKWDRMAQISGMKDGQEYLKQLEDTAKLMNDQIKKMEGQ